MKTFTEFLNEAQSPTVRVVASGYRRHTVTVQTGGANRIVSEHPTRIAAAAAAQTYADANGYKLEKHTTESVIEEGDFIKGYSSEEVKVHAVGKEVAYNPQNGGGHIGRHVHIELPSGEHFITYHTQKPDRSWNNFTPSRSREVHGQKKHVDSVWRSRFAGRTNESVIEEGAMDHVTKVIIHTNNNIGDKKNTYAVSVEKDGKPKKFFIGAHPNVASAKKHAEMIRKAAGLKGEDVKNWAE